MKIQELLESATSEGTSSGNVATAISTGNGSNVGTFFGGSYEQPNNPWNKKKKKVKKETMVRR
jgi:hypothetical protein